MRQKFNSMETQHQASISADRRQCGKAGVTNLQRVAGRTADYRDPRGPHPLLPPRSLYAAC